MAKLDGDKRLVMLIDPDQLLGARERLSLDPGQADAGNALPQHGTAALALARAA